MTFGHHQGVKRVGKKYGTIVLIYAYSSSVIYHIYFIQARINPLIINQRSFYNMPSPEF